MGPAAAVEPGNLRKLDAALWSVAPFAPALAICCMALDSFKTGLSSDFWTARLPGYCIFEYFLGDARWAFDCPEGVCMMPVVLLLEAMRELTSVFTLDCLRVAG